MPTAAITGANRGIGLEFARQYLADGWRVHAGARRPEAADGLAELASDALVVHELDVRDRAQIAALAAALDGEPVDLLINNAGVWRGGLELHGRFSDELWLEEFEVHVFGAMAMCQALAANLAAGGGGTAVNISSGNGCFGWTDKSPDYPYNSTKAALNMLARGLSVDLAGDGVVVANLSPGFVATDMTGHASGLTPRESVSGMRKVIAGLDMGKTGAMWRHDGGAMPW